MAHHHQPQAHQQSHLHLQQQTPLPHHHHLGMSSPQSSSSSAYQHFQPWRNFIKTEKNLDPDHPESGEMFFPQQATYAPPNLPQKPVYTNNPELELKLQQCIEEGDCVGDFAKKQIVQILESISLLKPPERVLLYLRMPGANCETDPLRQPQNPLGGRSEINQTINWVRSHLEPDPNVSIPKKDVYDDYIAFCGRNTIKPLSTADFGKVMKQVFPTVRPRRLGTRGHSRYCYAAMRKATKLDPPILPDMSGGGEVRVEALTNGPMEREIFSPPGASPEEPDNCASWQIIRSWAQRMLHVEIGSVKELADHIVKYNLMKEGPGKANSGSTGVTSTKENNNKNKDKRKTALPSSPEKPNSPAKRRRKKRKKGESSASGDGGDSEHSVATRVSVKREVDSANDDDQIMDLKIPPTDVAVGDNEMADKMPVKLLLNDAPLDTSTTATDSDDLQIENIYCKKVRQAQQAKGLWFQQQQQQQPQQLQASGHSSVIVTPHTFSQPEIPSPSMLNQIRQQFLADREGGMMSKNLNKRDGGGDGDDSIPRDFILPRERVISLCALDKDALDDYLPLAGDNSQEAEIMQYFDENSSNGQSTGGTDDSSPKVDEGQSGAVQMDSSSAGQSEAYAMFGGQMKPQSSPGDGQEKLSQLRQMLHINFQQQPHTSRPGQIVTNIPASTAQGYPGGSASASLSLLSQRHNSSGGYAVGMDLTQDPMSVPDGRPVSLKKRRLPQQTDSGEETAGQRRFVPIATPPHSVLSTVTDYTKISPGGRQAQFLSPKMAAAMKQQQQMDMQNVIPRASPGASPAASALSDVGMPMSERDGKADYFRPKFNQPSPQIHQQPQDGNYGGELKALNMSTFGESRSQSVPLNYRQSPVQVTSSNDGASWSSSYQNTNNANNSACSSVAPTPIPADYNDFTEMINIWESDAAPMPMQRQAGSGMEGSFGQGEPKDKNNNSDAFTEEMKSFASVPSTSITSRSVPSTPVPGGLPYYPKAFFNGVNNQGFGGYGQPQQQQQRSYDVSKSVPTTPIISTQFRYSPVAEVLSRRDILINGNINMGKALHNASSGNFEFDGVQGSGMGDDTSRESARRRMEKIEEDRKEAAAREQSSSSSPPLGDDMGYDPMMDSDLMNQF